MNLWPRILSSPEAGAPTGGMPKPPTPASPAPSSPAPEATGGPEYDDLGYEVVPSPGKPPEEPNKPAAQTPAAQGPQGTGETPSAVTGYGEEPKVDEPKPAPMPTPPKPAEPQSELDKAIAELPEDERAKMKAFAETHQLTPEVAKAYVEMRKTEIADAAKWVEHNQAEAKRAQQAQRAGWHKELKTDPDFGGDNFAANVAMVDRVLNEFMPGVKKNLTEKQGMLPPYFMRDLAKLGTHLFKTQENLVTGDAPAPEVKDDDDPLAFYQ